MEIPRDFNSLCLDLHDKYNFNNILFIRHHTGGLFLNFLTFPGNNVVTKLLYETHDINQPKLDPQSFTIIQHDDLKTHLKNFNQKYDLICLDPFHEYRYSIYNLELLTTYLSDTGVMVVHDCLPLDKELTVGTFVLGPWVGETYLAFLKYACDNTQFHYGLINSDFGLGIISKTKIMYTNNTFNEEIRNKFNLLLQNKDENIFDFVTSNINDLIHVLNPPSEAA